VKKIDKIIKRTWIISQQKLHTRIKNDMLYSPIHFYIYLVSSFQFCSNWHTA